LTRVCIASEPLQLDFQKRALSGELPLRLASADSVRTPHIID